MTAIALTIAGSDSGGGAGIQADLKTFSALGVYGASVVTALTAQNTLGVQGVHSVPPAFVRRQIDSVLCDIDVDVVKIGMLANPAIIRAVAAALTIRRDLPVVLDPVMVAASGDVLLAATAIGALKRHLFPLATLLTPNLHEAAALTGTAMARTEADMLAQARQLLGSGAAAVLIKGGHGSGTDSVDLLVTVDGHQRFAAPRIATLNLHGTGCTLSSAIAAGLARKLALVDAIDMAKRYVTQAIAASDRLSVGKGHGPTHHFHRWWSTEPSA
jgi:hydroxymethylpyrimidine/phosphomethylpyrimidine kinase